MQNLKRLLKERIENMSENIVIGVIGAGRIGRLHVENMLKMAGVRVKTVADPYSEHAKDWAEKLGIEQLVSNHEIIFNDAEINCVFICSPTDTHTTMIKAAAKAGKNIFCEKPISFSDEETIEAFKAVEKAGVKLQIGFNRRFDKNFDHVKKCVATGKIGELHILKITSRDPEPPGLDYVKSSGGLFMDMAIHDFDMARFVSGSEVEEVYVQGAALINPEFASLGDVDTAIITLKFANGALGVIDNSRKAVYGYDQRVEAFGSNGAVEIGNETETLAKLSTNSGVELDQPLHFFLERYNEAYIREVQEFFEAIQKDKAVPCSFEDGIMAQRIAQAAKLSLTTGKPVRVTKLIK